MANIFPESIISSPVFSDLDSDFIPEIIFFTGGGNLHIINLDITSYPSAPMTYTFSYSSSPAIHDLDSDGDLGFLVVQQMVSTYLILKKMVITLFTGIHSKLIFIGMVIIPIS